MADGLAAIDWRAPWFADSRDPGESVHDAWTRGKSLHDALNAHAAARTAPVTFVAQSALPEGIAYEQFIHDTRLCPTRDNLHDFFNGLCWLRFPEAKRTLNALQAAEIARAGISAVRGPVRDAITVFDENGAWLDAPAPLWEALHARDWKRLFVDLRALWDDARVMIIGHALLEKLVTPRKDLTAHVLIGELTAASLATKPFVPLPLMGIPGWSAGNADISFYDDTRVFRPPRQQEPRPAGPRTTQPFSTPSA